MSCTYLAHHELESVFVVVVVITINTIVVINTTRQILDETETFVAAGMDTNASCGIPQPPCRHD